MIIKHWETIAFVFGGTHLNNNEMENLKQFSDIFGSKLVLIVFVYILNLLSYRKLVSTFFTY